MESVLAVVIVLSLAGVAWGILGYAAQADRRTTEMQALASRLGWEFTAAPSLDVIPAAARLHLFSHGYSRRIRNLAAGRRGERQVALFDYRYVTGGGSTRREWKHTVAHVHTPGAACPRFEIRPETSLHRLGAVFGYQDINLPEHPAFSRACLLRGPDEAAIRGLFTPDVVEFFARNAHMCAEADGPDVFFWYPWRVEGEPMLTLIDNALTLAALLQGPRLRFAPTPPGSSPGFVR